MAVDTGTRLPAPQEPVRGLPHEHTPCFRATSVASISPLATSTSTAPPAYSPPPPDAADVGSGLLLARSEATSRHPWLHGPLSLP